MGINIQAVDTSDWTGTFAAWSRINEIHIDSVDDLVKQSKKLVKTKKANIDRLDIVDHGSTIGFEIGSDLVTSSSFGKHSSRLTKLRPDFTSNGFVHLHNCRVGKNRVLLLKLAACMGVPVYATTLYQNPIYRVNMGATNHEGWLTGKMKTIPNPFKDFEHYVRADPSGKFQEDVGRP